MPSTCSRILDYLRQRGPATAEELAFALGVTAADVRHHLAHLTGLSLVEVMGRRTAAGRGRPRKVYGLSTPSLGDNLEALAGAVLTLWLGKGGESRRASRLHALARHLAREDGEAAPTGMALGLRLKRAVERLNALHYQARWEASARGPRLILERCPYRSLAEEHPELCEVDARLLTLLTGAGAVQLARRAASPRGVPVCEFLLHLGPLDSFEAKR